MIIRYVHPCCWYCYYAFCYCNCNSSYNDIWNDEWAKLIFFFSYSRSEKYALSSFLKFRTKQIASELTCELGSESEDKKIAGSKTQNSIPHIEAVITERTGLKGTFVTKNIGGWKLGQCFSSPDKFDCSIFTRKSFILINQNPCLVKNDLGKKLELRTWKISYSYVVD